MAIEYRDLEIEISSCVCGEREVRVLQSPIDRPRERFTLDLDNRELQSLIDEYDGLLLQGPSETARRRRLAEEIGIRLFRAIFPGKVGETLRGSLIALEAARAHVDEGLRLRISFGDSASYDSRIGGLPWELLCEPLTRRFLAREPQNPVVRYLDLSRKIKPLQVKPPLRVLAVLPSPTCQRQIDVKRQEEVLCEAVRNRGPIQVHLLRPPTLVALRTMLTHHARLGEPFHVLHFVGHGGFTDDGRGALWFERPDRKQHVVTGQELGGQLSDLRDLRLVILASCFGGQIPWKEAQNPFTGAASALIGSGIPAVVAMQFTVSERAAANFTSGFYSKLSDSALDDALAEARLRVAAENTGGFEWATPILFLRSPDGKLVDLQAAEKPLQSAAAGQRSIKIEVGDVEAGKDAIVAGQKGSPPAGDDRPMNMDIKAGNIKAAGTTVITGEEWGQG